MINPIIRRLAVIQKSGEGVAEKIESLSHEDLLKLLDNMIESGRFLGIKYVISSLSSFDTDFRKQILIFKILPHISTYDANEIGGILTTIQRLDQKDIEWRTVENTTIVGDFIKRCKSISFILEDEVAELENLIK